jgi:hypothetical protein
MEDMWRVTLVVCWSENNWTEEQIDVEYSGGADNSCDWAAQLGDVAINKFLQITTALPISYLFMLFYESLKPVTLGSL